MIQRLGDVSKQEESLFVLVRFLCSQFLLIRCNYSEQIEALADRYMGINCACFTPNTERIDDIIRLAKEYKVDGIIDVNLKFCSLYDTEGYSVEKALKEAGIPVLGIETDYVDSDAEQLRTRISAFLEMLNN